jgi:hypothetical protein
VADWLGGGHGLLLTLLEAPDRAWAASPMLEQVSRFPLPRLRPWRKLAAVPAALAFLAAVLWLPQRVPGQEGNPAMAEEMVAELTTALADLKQQELITPAEEKNLEDEIARIRRAARERVDSSAWEAADALREKVADRLSEKQDAVKWAEQTLGRYAAAAGAEAGGQSNSESAAAELKDALDKLASNGLLAAAPADLQRLLKGGKLPSDAKSLAELSAALSRYLAETNGRIAGLGKLAKEFGRFDPAEFPVGSDAAAPGSGNPGQGAANRGRADAALTWGRESLPFDRFKAAPLPPGAARSADDWAPLVQLPGAPQESAQPGAPSATRQYAAVAGQAAWRRTLAPRHHSAVKKYFEK